jgi:hypothetical protein
MIETPNIDQYLQFLSVDDRNTLTLKALLKPKLD